MPSQSEEIWRYSRVDELDPGRFAPAAPDPSAPGPDAVAWVVDLIGAHSGLAVTVDGTLIATEAAAAGLQVRPAEDGDEIGSLTSEAEPWDAFVELNTAQAPVPLVVAIAPDTVVDDPIVVCHWSGADAVATFPRTSIRVGQNARATVVEYHLSAEVTSWSDPVAEVELADGAHLDHLIVQELGTRMWQTAYNTYRVGRDASLRTFTVALGGEYARVRTDSTVVGAGGEAQLAALYSGDGTQMHDFRTLQDHVGPKSTSDLVFKGAVAGDARSAYSGLIRIRRGAGGTRAFQTNRNLVLSDTGLATYSVPNLDIEESDVSCSHASATGPIDPDQRFYLESRGVPPEVAERLIVLGFFDDLLARLPVPSLRHHLGSRLSEKLSLDEGSAVALSCAGSRSSPTARPGVSTSTDTASRSSASATRCTPSGTAAATRTFPCRRASSTRTSAPSNAGSTAARSPCGPGNPRPCRRRGRYRSMRSRSATASSWWTSRERRATGAAASSSSPACGRGSPAGRSCRASISSSAPARSTR